MTRRTLRDEIRQTRPFHSAGQEAALGVLRTADVLKRRFAAVLAPAGITTQQYNVLRILRGAGAAGLPTLEIAERMIEQAPGITRLVDRLEAAGLVARERSTEDRRAVVCRATPKALALLAGLDAAVDAADDAALGPLTDTELRQLIRLLEKVREETP
jgi:DNA-binding MarR family transcriptional regulator